MVSPNFKPSKPSHYLVSNFLECMGMGFIYLIIVSIFLLALQQSFNLISGSKPTREVLTPTETEEELLRRILPELDQFPLDRTPPVAPEFHFKKYPLPPGIWWV